MHPASSRFADGFALFSILGFAPIMSGARPASALVDGAHDTSAVGTSKRVDVPEQVQHQPEGGNDHSTESGSAMHKDWYAFIDGSHDSQGNRVPFATARSALAWIVATLAFAGLWIAGPLVLLIVGTQKAVVLGFLAVLVPSAGPLVLAALIAALHASFDLKQVIGDQVRRWVH
jgi:hypothetical protein